MPRLDGTGPQGMGPRTGGGRGRCVLPTDQTPAPEQQLAQPQSAGGFGPFQWLGRGVGGGGWMRRGGGNGGRGRGCGGGGGWGRRGR
jgi:hypothetical protein